MTYASDILAKSPLAYYRLNETSSLVDSSGNARHGTFIGGTTTAVTGLVTGDSDQAVSFASSGRGEVTSASWMYLTQFTIMATIKPTAVSGNQTVVSRYLASGNVGNMWLLRISTKIDWFIAVGTGNGSASGTTTLIAGNTYDVCGTYNGSTGAVRVYLNGFLEGTATVTGMNASPTAPLCIGTRSPTTDPFTGVIDDVAYIPSVLTAAEVEALTSSRRGGVSPPEQQAAIVVQTAMILDPSIIYFRPAATYVSAAIYVVPPPSNVMATNTYPSTSITLTWDDPIDGHGITRYEVYLDGGTPINVDLAETYTFTGLTTGLSYHVAVRVIDTDGRASEWQERGLTLLYPPMDLPFDGTPWIETVLDAPRPAKKWLTPKQGVSWWDGEERQPAIPRGWWDGAVEQPVTLDGHRTLTGVDEISQ